MQNSDHSSNEVETERFNLECVLAALCYADVFDFAIRSEEIKSYLPLERVSEERLQQTLDLLVMQRRLFEQDGFYCLESDSGRIETRKRRIQLTREKWQKAIPALKHILAFNFIRSAALTGSLAANNSNENADVDLLLIMDHRRMWLGFFIVRLWAKFQRQTHPCPNYVIGDNQLELMFPSYFTAVEFALSKPLKSVATFQKIEAANTWLRQWTPSSAPLRSKVEDLKLQRKWYHKLIDGLVSSPIGAVLNFIEGKRVHWRSRGLYVPRPYVYKPHAPYRMIHIYQCLQDRLRVLGIEQSQLGDHVRQTISLLVEESRRWEGTAESRCQAHASLQP